MDELFEQTKGIYETKSPSPSVFAKQIAFNVIPQIDVFLDDGSTKEEWKMVVEPKKILDPKIKVTATCVRVPVLRAHAIAVNFECEQPITPAEVRELIGQAPGVKLVDDPENNHFPMPNEASGGEAILVGRIRADISDPSGRSVALFAVGDQLLKGAALNAVQIAELL